jgi:hypothetical protein
MNRTQQCFVEKNETLAGSYRYQWKKIKNSLKTFDDGHALTLYFSMQHSSRLTQLDLNWSREGIDKVRVHLDGTKERCVFGSY